MKCECKDCKIRSVGCHGRCKSYQEFKKYNDELKGYLKLDEAEQHLIDNNRKIGHYLENKKKRSKRVGMW